MTTLFVELGLIIALAGGLSIIAQALKQPLVVAYIATGILVSPILVGGDKEVMEALAQIGVALLLFVVGLGLSPSVLKRIGKVAFVTAVGQLAFSALIVYAASRIMGIGFLPAIYIGAALMFSSTIIVVHFLSEKGELERLHGVISIGILIVQDLVAVFLLMASTSLEQQAFAANDLLLLAVRGGILLFFMFLVSAYVIPHITRYVAQSRELLFILSLAWLFMVASAFALAGFSIEVGALLAGVALSVSTYRFEISARLRSIRDFFIILFFVLLGLSLNTAAVMSVLGTAIILSLLILVGKPLIVMFVMGLMGYTRRAYFFTGMALAQVSEFSFILIARGMDANLVPEYILTLATLVGIITITFSAYMILYSEKLFKFFEPVLWIFDHKKVIPHEEGNEFAPEYILFGHNRIGYAVMDHFKNTPGKVLVIDYDPAVIERLHRKGFHAWYGDASDQEFLRELPWGKVKYIISTIPSEEVGTLLIRQTKKSRKTAKIITTSHDIEEALRLYRHGANFVIMPHFLGGHFMVDMLQDIHRNPRVLTQRKRKAVSELNVRHRLGEISARQIL